MYIPGGSNTSSLLVMISFLLREYNSILYPLCSASSQDVPLKQQRGGKRPPKKQQYTIQKGTMWSIWVSSSLQSSPCARPSNLASVLQSLKGSQVCWDFRFTLTRIAASHQGVATDKTTAPNEAMVFIRVWRVCVCF